MHILFLTDNFPPDVNAPASRTHEHCRVWVQAGHQVTVLTTAPNFPRGKLYPGYRNRLWQRETMDGITVIRVWTYIAPNRGVNRRTLDYLSFMVGAILGACRVRKPDVVVGTSPQFFTTCGAWAVSVLKGCPFVFELRDLWPASIHAVGAIKASLPLRLIEKMELFLYDRAARVVAVTKAYRRNLIDRGVDGRKISVVTNGVCLRRYQPNQSTGRTLRRQLGLDENTFIAGYIGTLGMAHHLETVLRAARLVQDQVGARIQFILMGDGARRDELRETALKLGVNNVLFLEPVSKDDVVGYWNMLNVSIIHVANNPLFESVIPSKLFECMAMGVPVLHGLRGESADIVRETGCGETFEPGNAQQLAERVRALSTNPEALARYSAAGIVASQHYGRRDRALAMLKVLEQAHGSTVPLLASPPDIDDDEVMLSSAKVQRDRRGRH